MTRLVPRKSLPVLGLLATVLGSSAATAAAVTTHPAATARHASATAALRPAVTAYATTAHPAAARSASSALAAVTTAAVRDATPAAYPQAFLATASPAPAAATTAAVTTAAVQNAAAAGYPQAFLATATSTPVTGSTATAVPAAEPAGGVCSVPGIGDIGNLLGLCNNGSPLVNDLNNICQPSLPQPEPANGGIDSIIRPPGTAPPGKTLYDNYGVAGQFWAATDLQCSDMTSLIGNNVAGMVFDAAKAVDRVTITVYQSAAGNGILSWLSNVVDRLISSLGNAIYFPYLAPVVLLGVIWLAWHGLIRKRATRAVEGTIWMVVACAAAIWLIGRPADFTGFGQSVSNGVTQVLNVAFSKLPNPGGGNCVPVRSGDPQSPAANFGFTQGNGLVDQNANELWSVLVCKPWLDGEFGTTQYSTGHAAPTPVNSYGRQLLWAQAIAANETPTAALIKAKQAVYSGIAASIKQKDPVVYPLFQGNQWTSRMEIGFAALFAALVAGVLVLLIAITLIVLKLGFLLLLIAGPFFLIVGTHPGFGRVVAMRWVEMIIGVLLKLVAVAIVLSVLLYAYSLIMGTSDVVLPWALKILMIALVTIAVFIYRKPFQHLFSAVGYGSIGARERAEFEMYRSREVLRRNTVGAATAAATGFAGYRVGRWSRRGPAQSAALAEHIAMAGGSASPDTGGRPAPGGQGLADANGQPGEAEAADGQAAGSGGRAGADGNGRGWGGAATGAAPQAAPPLHLPARAARGGDDAQSAPSGWARGGAETAGTIRPTARAGDAPPRPATPRIRPAGTGCGRSRFPGRRPATADRKYAAGRESVPNRGQRWPGAARGRCRRSGAGREQRRGGAAGRCCRRVARVRPQRRSASTGRRWGWPTAAGGRTGSRAGADGGRRPAARPVGLGDRPGFGGRDAERAAALAARPDSSPGRMVRQCGRPVRTGFPAGAGITGAAGARAPGIGGTAPAAVPRRPACLPRGRSGVRRRPGFRNRAGAGRGPDFRRRPGAGPWPGFRKRRPGLRRPVLRRRPGIRHRSGRAAAAIPDWRLPAGACRARRLRARRLPPGQHGRGQHGRERRDRERHGHPA